ncbi:Uncharacterised protein [Salmonella enterica subsp. enterica serovar Bovismorbificans]|uniref:Uncharacterized protein n=1 Tax=Salmonella enterica subsp. enterica serovar Bovismorbificans TaxID=58097 RepID=A0A655D4D3_SALET|nr:Uncharacterised protein [Salmonella enterica subsp. enterica serovar Bovismorbificans]
MVNRVNTWLTSKPPTIAIPNGRRNSAPTPVLNINGNAPSNAASVVIRIGRKRSRQAWKIASRGLIPCSRSAARAKSIIMMAFFFTMPISKIMPIMAIISSSLPAMISASSAPTPAVGSVERIVIGWIKLSYSTPSTIYIATTAATISQTVLPSAAWKASVLP